MIAGRNRRSGRYEDTEASGRERTDHVGGHVATVWSLGPPARDRGDCGRTHEESRWKARHHVHQEYAPPEGGFSGITPNNRVISSLRVPPTRANLFAPMSEAEMSSMVFKTGGSVPSYPFSHGYP